MNDIIGIWDLILAPIYFTFMLLITRRHQKKHEQELPYYRYYTKGFLVKIFSSVIFCFIYAYYYKGGDTVNYFLDSKALSNLMTQDFGHYWEILMGRSDSIAYSYFNGNTGYPHYYMWKDENTFIVSRLTSVITFFCGKSFITTTIFLSFLSYFGAWKLFKFFLQFYPKLERELAIATLFIPSVVFWGSGIMKDTYTYAAACWFIYSVYRAFFDRNKQFTNILIILLTAWLIILIKPYIFVALLPGTLLWIFFNQLKKVKHFFVRILILPATLTLGVFIFSSIFSGLSENLGDYGSFESIIEKAQITQEDLMREEQYGSNFYDLGKIDPSFSGMMRIAPKALIAGLYRPFIWESRSIVILFSGLENLILLYFSLLIIVKSGIKKFISTLFGDPVLLFSFFFSTFFLFSVGLSTANFGALVRYKIPAMPFFVATIFIIYYHYHKLPKEEAEKANTEKLPLEN